MDFVTKLYCQKDDRDTYSVYDDPAKVPAGIETAEYHLHVVGTVAPVFSPVKKDRKPRKDKGVPRIKENPSA